MSAVRLSELLIGLSGVADVGMGRYPPDKQPEAIRLVIEQMEAMAPRYAA